MTLKEKVQTVLITGAIGAAMLAALLGLSGLVLYVNL